MPSSYSERSGGSWLRDACRASQCHRRLERQALSKQAAPRTLTPRAIAKTGPTANAGGRRAIIGPYGSRNRSPSNPSGRHGISSTASGSSWA